MKKSEAGPLKSMELELHSFWSVLRKEQKKKKSKNVSRRERGARGDEGMGRHFWDRGEGYTPDVLVASMQKRLKRWEIGKSAETSVRKRIQTKDLGNFLGG